MSDADTTTAARDAIAAGRTALGIELGSTRIKAVLTGPDHQPIAVGGHAWENQFVDRSWTYSLDAVWAGLQDCYAGLAADVQSRYGIELTTVGALGISAMMHGYLAFDADDALLTPFRTWRNTSTGPASEQLSTEFGYNIPHRWSIAHLYQAVLNGEDHVGSLAQLTTLAGYVHWQLSGERVLGVGDASGMFPIDVSHPRLRRDHAEPFRRADHRGRSRARCGRRAAHGAAGRRGGRVADRRRRPTAGPERATAARRTDGAARGRCGDRDGRHPLDRAADRQRQRRHQHLRHGRARTRAQPRPPRARPGHHPGR